MCNAHHTFSFQKIQLGIKLPVTGWCQSPVGISSSWPGARFDDMSLLTFPVRVAFSTHMSARFIVFSRLSFQNDKYANRLHALVTSKKGLKSDKSDLSKTDREQPDAIWNLLRFEFCISLDLCAWPETAFVNKYSLANPSRLQSGFDRNEWL